MLRMVRASWCKRVAAAGGLLVAALAVPRPCEACINEVLSTSETRQKLREAEEAIDEGDVAEARELAATVAESEAGSGRVGSLRRADAIFALSFVRDRSASQPEIESALLTLHARAEQRHESPDALADVGEAEERAGHDAEALRILQPLAERDLLGSSWAYAALGRAAHRRGEEDRAQGAFARCRTMASVPSTCDGVPGRRPLLRPRNVGFALPWVILGAASLRRRLGRKRALWKSHRARAFHVLALVAAAVACLFGRSPWVAAGIAAASAILLAAVQQRSFVSAVTGGRIAGLGLRQPDPADERLPVFGIFFGPAAPQTLERVPDAGYRDAARIPLLRLERRRPLRAHVVAAVAVAMVTSAVLAGFFAFSRTLYGTETEYKAEPVSAIPLPPPPRIEVLSPLPSASEAAPNHANHAADDAAPDP